MFWWAAHTYLFEVAVAGVRMFTYRKGYMHQKVFLVDDTLAGVGTVNLDNRSLRINFEITMAFTDPDFIRKVEKMCRDDFAASDPPDHRRRLSPINGLSAWLYGPPGFFSPIL